MDSMNWRARLTDDELQIKDDKFFVKPEVQKAIPTGKASILSFNVVCAVCVVC